MQKGSLPKGGSLCLCCGKPGAGSAGRGAARLIPGMDSDGLFFIAFEKALDKCVYMM